MQSSNKKTQALLVFLCIAIASVMIAGSFFIGMRVGMYRSFLTISNMFEAGQTADDIMQQSPNKVWTAAKKGGFGFKGYVVSVDTGSLLVKSKKGEKRTLLISKKTQISIRGKRKKAEDIGVGDYVISIGTPTPDGDMNTTFIRAEDAAGK